MKERGFRRAEQRMALRFGTVAPTESGIMVDVSHKGLCFQCEELPKGKEMVIHLDTGPETLEVIARKKWAREVSRLNQLRYRVGVEVVQAPRSFHRLVQKLAYH